MCVDIFCSSYGVCECCVIGDFVEQSCLMYGLVVGNCLSVFCCVEDQLDFFVFDCIDNVWLVFYYFVDFVCCDFFIFQEFLGVVGGNDFKVCGFQVVYGFQDISFVLIVYGDEYGFFFWDIGVGVDL